jgi:hypothetical protein
MKYYSATTSIEEVDSVTIQPSYNILCSFHYWKKKSKIIKNYLEKGFDVFIDSGAFSSMNSNKIINIDNYCKFLINTNAIYYATLDVIGDAKATLKNHKYMIKEYGLNPIPTFHMGSKIKDLEPLMEYNYIALGGLVFSSGIMNHCDEVWHYILTNNPSIKVHGFGLTNIELMKRYPWHSVDSSSYLSCQKFGREKIIWNGLDFKTFEENDFIDFLKLKGYDIKNKSKSELKRLYRYYSSQSYKIYAAHLNELNKIKSFNYLTQQTKLF